LFTDYKYWSKFWGQNQQIGLLNFY